MLLLLAGCVGLSLVALHRRGRLSREARGIGVLLLALVGLCGLVSWLSVEAVVCTVVHRSPRLAQTILSRGTAVAVYATAVGYLAVLIAGGMLLTLAFRTRRV